MKKIKLKTIEGYEGLYSITEDGRIWSEDRWVDRPTLKHKYLKKGRWLKPSFNSDGYLYLCLYKNQKSKTHRVHRLVAQTYISNPLNKPEINHKNLIKTDNHFSNLEWVNHRENMQHAWEFGAFDNRDNSGENNGFSKFTWKEVNEMRQNHHKMKYGDKPYEKYGIDSSHYYDIINNKYWYDSKYKKEIVKNAII